MCTEVNIAFVKLSANERMSFVCWNKHNQRADLGNKGFHFSLIDENQPDNKFNLGK